MKNNTEDAKPLETVSSEGADARGTKIAAFFDADETLIKGSSAYYLARELYRRKFFGWKDIAFAARHAFIYVVFGEDMERIQKVSERATQVMAGHSIAELEAIGDEMYDSMLGERVFAGTKRILEQHLRDGCEVWLISATPTQMVQLIARRMGATGGLGSDIEIKDGILQPRLAGPMMHGRAKADTIRKLAATRGLDLAASYAYSDSLNDLPLLYEVGNPVAVNPDPRLRVYAKRLGWRIHDFRHRRTTSAVGALKLSAAVTFGLWVIRKLLRRLR